MAERGLPGSSDLWGKGLRHYKYFTLTEREKLLFFADGPGPKEPVPFARKRGFRRRAAFGRGAEAGQARRQPPGEQVFSLENALISGRKRFFRKKAEKPLPSSCFSVKIEWCVKAVLPLEISADKGGAKHGKM